MEVVGMNILDFTLNFKDTILDAIRKIENNKKGFLIIVDNNSHVVGTLTDGDIRRALLSGKNLNSKIEGVYNKDYKFVYVHDDFGQVVESFKSVKIEFLPILNSEKKLVNIITKKNMHVLLMEDIEFDMAYDFLSLDDSILEQEIYNRPWGFYKSTFINKHSQSKIITVKPLQQLSLQKHLKREEHWIVIKGEGTVYLEESVKKIGVGDYVFIPKGCKHRLINTSDIDTLMLTEVQIGTYFGEDDIIRYKDVYGRVCVKE